jgi:hypothetical protein
MSRDLIRLPLLLLAVTAFGAAQSSGKAAAPPPVYTISGQITGMAAGQRAYIVAKAANKTPREVPTRMDGRYTLDAVPPGVYDVRPRHAHDTFTPDFRTVAVTNHNIVGIDFTVHAKPK